MFALDEPEFDELAAAEIESSTEELAGEGGSENQIDDPVRMYLMQMGEIPLLSRVEEIDSAKRIEFTRRRFRHSMLASDYLLHGAVALLEKVRDGKLRLDRTIEVSVTNTTGKKKIMQRLGPNLKTLVHLLRRNRADFRIAISRSTPISERRDSLETVGLPPQQGRAADRRTESAHRSPATAVAQTGRDFAADGHPSRSTRLRRRGPIGLARRAFAKNSAT